jgi:hypothetical protein
MYPVSLKTMLSMITFVVRVPSIIAETFPVSGLVVSGKVARVHRGTGGCAQKSAGRGKASNLGGKSAWVEAISIRRRP